METPTISKKQSKKTLSGKKKKTEVIKNVLAKPYQNYWPLLSPEDNNHLKETLERLLPKIKNDKINIPYKEIKAIPRDERKKFRETYTKQQPIAPVLERESLIFGVNGVSKSLENQEAGSVLVASDVQPRLLVQHILDQAVLYNVPVLVMQGLREVFKSRCGLGGVTVAFNRTIKADSELGLIQQAICNIYENYPVPDKHINYQRKLDITTVTIPDSENERTVCFSSDSDNEVVEMKNSHLKRESSNKRTFVPDNSERVEMTSFIDLDTTASTGCSPPSAKKTKGKAHYRPLVVKRLKGNKNRNKRKMEKFKKKEK